MILDGRDITLFNGDTLRELMVAVADDDARLEDARTPLPHHHPASDITGLVVYNFGTVAGSMCQGNDGRLADARTPTVHSSALHDASVEATANKAAASGYCDLDAGAKVPAARLPAITGIVPIGAIIAWHKDLAGCPALPAQFRECDGSPVADAASPFNGLNMPNLNTGHTFLAGTGGATGATGGAVANNANLTFLSDGATVPAGVDGGQLAVLAQDYSYSVPVIPPYMVVIWIMRIK